MRADDPAAREETGTLHLLKKRRIKMSQRIYQPSAAQIRAACRAIQQDWSDRDWQSRAEGVYDNEWYPPGVWERLRVGGGKRGLTDDE